jgi:magnesium chelatase family protein
MATATGAGIWGVDGVTVEVQLAAVDGLPGIDITGLPAATMREARHRIRSAFRAAAYEWPNERLVVNFAPADLPKAGTGYDLPLAASVLAHAKHIPLGSLEDCLLYGELGLDGSVRPIAGTINAALAARSAGITRFFTAPDAATEAALVPGLKVVAVSSLITLVELLRGDREVLVTPPPSIDNDRPAQGFELAHLRGQHRARRALEVAAAGGHNLLLMGPPGCGKTLLARAFPGILPSLTLEESLEVARIHSVAFGTRPGHGLRRQRPFRSPHASASHVAMVGGGRPLTPGEVSLAHRGVLFLDETPEFERRTLEALRAPLEDRHVTIARSGRQATFPAAFSIVCAMNPCPCGHRDDPGRLCRCTPDQVDRYKGRLSGPLMDRIDIQVEMTAVSGEQLASKADGESTHEVAERVAAARKRQLARNQTAEGRVSNAELDLMGVERHAALGQDEQAFLVQASRTLGLTARSWHRVVRVARTVADLAGHEQVTLEDLSEALTYRLMELARTSDRPVRGTPTGRKG